MVRISGKHFVVPFAVVLCLLLGLMLSVAFRFQAVMTQLEEVRSLWPMASAVLSDRYAKVDAAISASAGVSESLKTEWKNALVEFQDSTRYDQQCPRAMVLERWLASNADELKGTAESIQPIDSTVAITKLVESDSKRGQLQSGFIGELTVASLRLKLPPVFSVAKKP